MWTPFRPISKLVVDPLENASPAGPTVFENPLYVIAFRKAIAHPTGKRKSSVFDRCMAIVNSMNIVVQAPPRRDQTSVKAKRFEYESLSVALSHVDLNCLVRGGNSTTAIQSVEHRVSDASFSLDFVENRMFLIFRNWKILRTPL